MSFLDDREYDFYDVPTLDVVLDKSVFSTVK